MNFSILTGAGSVGAATDSSDVSGLAAVSWTMGTTAGGNTMKAEDLGLPGTPKTINFSATGTHDAADTLVYTIQPSADQIVNNTFATQPVVEIRDTNGNLVDTGAGASLTISLSPPLRSRVFCGSSG